MNILTGFESSANEPDANDTIVIIVVVIVFT